MDELILVESRAARRQAYRLVRTQPVRDGAMLLRGLAVFITFWAVVLYLRKPSLSLAHLALGAGALLAFTGTLLLAYRHSESHLRQTWRLSERGIRLRSFEEWGTIRWADVRHWTVLEPDDMAPYRLLVLEYGRLGRQAHIWLASEHDLGRVRHYFGHFARAV